jgi:hypothetical protein
LVDVDNAVDDGNCLDVCLITTAVRRKIERQQWNTYKVVKNDERVGGVKEVGVAVCEPVKEVNVGQHSERIW